MRLDELFDTDVDVKNINRRFNTEHEKKVNLRKPTDRMGAGLASKDAPVINDPHMHKKWNRVATTDLDVKDPYWFYVMSLAVDGIAAGNPHFPRVYNIKVLRDLDKKEKNKAVMERLRPLNFLNIDQLKSILEHTFDLTENQLKTIHNAKNPNFLINLMIDFIERSMIDQSVIKMDSFKEAVEYIKNMKDRNNFSFDIHKGNIMIRHGSNIPQMVIIDPFAPRNEYQNEIRSERPKMKPMTPMTGDRTAIPANPNSETKSELKHNSNNHNVVIPLLTDN